MSNHIVLVKTLLSLFQLPPCGQELLCKINNILFPIYLQMIYFPLFPSWSVTVNTVFFKKEKWECGSIVSHMNNISAECCRVLRAGPEPGMLWYLQRRHRLPVDRYHRCETWKLRLEGLLQKNTRDLVRPHLVSAAFERGNPANISAFHISSVAFIPNKSETTFILIYTLFSFCRTPP